MEPGKVIRHTHCYSIFASRSSMLMMATLLLSIWTAPMDAADNSSTPMVVGDSYAVLLAEDEGWDLCGKGGASFDEIVSLILRCGNWQGRQVHLLWGVAHYVNGTEEQVVNAETDMLVNFLKQQGISNIIVFSLKDMLGVLQESGEFRRDFIHLNRAGYEELYARKGLSLPAAPAQLLNKS